MKNLPNFILMNGLWLAAVLGSAQAVLWPAYLIFVLMVLDAWHRPVAGDWPILIASLLFGLSVDILIHLLGWMQYAYVGHGLAALSPVWIMMLWLGFGWSLNRSMAWVHGYPRLGLLFILIGAPLSYLTAAKMGAITMDPGHLMLSLLAVIWVIYWILVWNLKQPASEVADATP